MRIADRFKYDLFMYQFNNVKTSLDRIQEQMAKQKRVLRPSDDPVAYAISVDLRAESVIYDQLERNILRVTTFGKVYDTVFGTMKDLLAEAKSVAINHAAGSMDDALRKNAVKQVESIIEQLVALGNTVVGDTYVFGGKKSNSAPFRLNPDYSVDFIVPEGSEQGNDIFIDRGNKAQYTISGRDAFYNRSKTIYESPNNKYRGEMILNTTDLAYVVDGTNNTIYRNGSAITLTQGTYTGATLASEIQTRLNELETGHAVTYDASTRRFTFANNTTNNITLDWSNPGSTAGQMLGFSAVDATVLANGGWDKSDVDTGTTSFQVEILDNGYYQYSVNGGAMSGPVAINGGTFIDGSTEANAINRGIRITFSTTEGLTEGDSFEIKDYSIFEMLKNLRDALSDPLSNNANWSRTNIAKIDEGLNIIRRNTAYVGTNLQTMDRLTEANNARQNRTAKIISDTMDADLAQLATEYSNLSTIYQSLMYSFTKIQELGLLNFLK
ncbi:MAG TPA: flagellar hook-associated protein FlgL [Syntrophorhabdus sp.]|nr:flagellar hook-associated protein FlgL [Pseudomonadota bacterium]HNY69568.1 flagellar hook-associated protein FlgL [Syntrophorhabdus sp.]HOH25637.1 flagellar hook-associated protein FlgL [Syntrophorhabdus sp.]